MQPYEVLGIRPLSKAALHVSFLCSKLPKSTERNAGVWMRSLHVLLVLPYREVEVTTRCVANIRRSQGLWDLRRDPHCQGTHSSTFSTQSETFATKNPL